MKIILFYVVSGIVFLLNNIFEKHYYKTNFKSEKFLEYVQAGTVLSNDAIDITPEKLAKVKWTKNDNELYQCWFWIDNKIFTNESIIELAEISKSHRSVGQVKFWILQTIKQERYFIILILFFFISGLIFYNKSDFIKLFLFGGTLCAYYLYLIVFMRLPHRIFFPPLIFLGLLGIYNFLSKDKEIIYKKFKLFTVVFLLTILPLMIYQLRILRQTNLQNLKYRKDFIAASNDLEKIKNKFVVICGAEFPFEGIPMFEKPNKSSCYNTLITCWTIGGHDYINTLKKHNINYLPEDIKKRNNILLLLGKESKEYFTNYYKEHHNVDIEFINYNDSFNFLRPFEFKIKK